VPSKSDASAIEVREAAEADAEAMADYMAALYADPDLDTVARRPPPPPADERDFVRRALASPRAVVLLALDGARVVGMLDLFAWDRPEGAHCGRLGMSVARAWRGKGVGRRLLRAAIAHARGWPGFCRIELDVAPWNTPAIALYESLGFKHEGRRVKAMNLRGRPEDILTMGLVW
jgi:RimJ/RimL family protein N-acetyltransferase